MEALIAMTVGRADRLRRLSAAARAHLPGGARADPAVLCGQPVSVRDGPARPSAAPPVIADRGAPRYADPLPQALVLTAIVIGFGMTAFVDHAGVARAGELGRRPTSTTSAEASRDADR